MTKTASFLGLGKQTGKEYWKPSHESFQTFSKCLYFTCSGVMHHKIRQICPNCPKLSSLTLISNCLLLFQNCMFHSGITRDLKAFTDKFGFDVLILLASHPPEEQQPSRQVAVYSENLELCSQVRVSAKLGVSHCTVTACSPNLWWTMGMDWWHKGNGPRDKVLEFEF